MRWVRTGAHLPSEHLAPLAGTSTHFTGISARRFVERNRLHLAQLSTARDQHDAAHLHARADASVRDEHDFRQTLILDDRHERRLNAPARQQVGATRWRSIHRQLHFARARAAHKTPDERRGVQITRCADARPVCVIVFADDASALPPHCSPANIADADANAHTRTLASHAPKNNTRALTAHKSRAK